MPGIGHFEKATIDLVDELSALVRYHNVGAAIPIILIIMWLKVVSNEIILLYLHTILYKKSETDSALLSGRASASGHLEKKSTRVMMKRLPHCVFGSGPTRSIPT